MATSPAGVAASMPPQAAQPPSPNAAASSPFSLYDLFLDLPHPAGSKACPGPFLIPSPVTNNGVTEQEIQAIIPQIARFAFPEYDESAPSSPRSGNVADSLNQFDFYAMQNESFTQFTFTLQLQSGQRLHGHVRRYLPPHLGARTRYDVGRRGERALVILTRATGADLLYSAILKSIEAISSQQAVLSASGISLHNGSPQQWFLHQLSRYQQHLSQMYYERQAPNERGKPLIASIPGLELGDEHEILRTKFKECDTSRFIIPTSLLVRQNLSLSNGNKLPPPQASAAGSIVPLLRCVGVAHALRILAALLSERRVILISSSPTRLAACSHSAVSILAVGLLHWQHLYIPVLPPHLWQYLAAPYPYLIGILSNTIPRLDRTEGLGEVLLIHLDTNQMETRGMETNTIGNRLPDLFRATVDQVQNQVVQSTVGPSSASEQLAQDLLELLREDKKVLYGESTLNRVGEKAAIATKAVKQTFLKLRDKGRQYLQQRMASGYEDSQPPSQENGAGEDDGPPEINSMASDYVYTEGCLNENAEQEARIAFTSFFLCLLGDMRWYLSTTPGQPLPSLDRKKFLQQKHAMGDGDGSPMWPLLNNFCQTQMLEEFAKARIEEVSSRAPISSDMPLFLQCAAYCRQHNLDFGLLTCRRIARQIADGSPARLTGLIQTNARRTAMSLTSNKAFEGDYEQALAQLVEQCRESTSILFDVMSVIWLRLRDCKGMQWKHAHQALQLLRNLLYHGPLAAIAEATDGLSKIRALKFYENIRAQNANLVRSSAVLVYNLLVDRAKLFHIRRVCANRRRMLQSKTAPRYRREINARIGAPFRNIHALMHPSASSGTVVPIPPKAPTNQTMERGAATTPQQMPVAPQDLLDGGSNVRRDSADVLTDFFDSAAISSQQGGSGSNSTSNPFDAFAQTISPPVAPQVPPTQIPPQGQSPITPAHQQNAQAGPQLFRSPGPSIGAAQVVNQPTQPMMLPNQPGSMLGQPNAPTMTRPPQSVGFQAQQQIGAQQGFMPTPQQIQHPHHPGQGLPQQQQPFQGQNFAAAPHPYSQQQQQQQFGQPYQHSGQPSPKPPQMNMNQFDPFAKK